MDLCISPAVPGFRAVELSVDMAICVFVFLTLLLVFVHALRFAPLHTLVWIDFCHFTADEYILHDI